MNTVNAKIVGTNMVVGDVVEEESACPSQERPVDGGNSAAEERPLFITVMSDCRVGVMKVGQHYDPMVRQLSPTEVRYR